MISKLTAQRLSDFGFRKIIDFEPAFCPPSEGGAQDPQIKTGLKTVFP